MDIAQWQRQVSEHLVKGQYGEAIALCEQGIHTDPTFMLFYWYLGLVWLLQGEDSEAQAIWLSAITQATPEEMDECTAELLIVLESEAIRFLQNREFQISEKIYWQILELDSNNSEAYYNLGNALAQQGNFDAAIDCWQTAIDIKPDLVEAYKEWGRVSQKLEDFEQAIACYLKTLELNPDDYQTAYHLGLCFLQQGRLDEAIACFEGVIQLQADYTQAYGDCGIALLQKGKLDEAIVFFKKAITISFTQAYLQWSDSLEKQGRANDAITTHASLFKALHLQSNSFDTYFYLGKLLNRNNQTEIAIAAYKKALDFKESAEVYLELGKTLTSQGNLELAIAAYQTAIHIQPDSDEVYLELGKSLAKKGNLEGAIATYQKALEINPVGGEVYLYLGNALSNNGQWKEAITCYLKQVDIQPRAVDAYCNLGMALAQENKADEALVYFRKFMDINPDFSTKLYDCIIHLGQQNKLNQKSLEFEKNLPVDPPNDFYHSTWDWAVTSNVEASNYFTIYLQNTIDLTPPLSPDKTIHFSFRFGDKMKLPASFVALIPNARYWLSKSQDKSAVITSEDKFLADVSPDFPVLSPGHPDKHPRKHSILSCSKLPPIQRIDGTVAVLSGLLNDVYFHWMFDILPRIELLHKSGIEMASIDYFLINNRLPFQKETLKTLGIADAKILEADQYPHIKATKLVVPSFPGTVAWMPKWACDFLRNVFLSKNHIEGTEKIDRLYISRKEATNRRIINEDEVINLLNKFGFQSVTLDSMSVVEQAALLANAKVVIAPHGSGLTNTVFCDPGTKVIEIFSPNYVYPCYWLISNLVGLEYYYLLGENSHGFYLHKVLYPDSRIEDIFVNLDDLLNLMKFAQVI